METNAGPRSNKTATEEDHHSDTTRNDDTVLEVDKDEDKHDEDALKMDEKEDDPEARKLQESNHEDVPDEGKGNVEPKDRKDGAEFTADDSRQESSNKDREDAVADEEKEDETHESGLDREDGPLDGREQGDDGGVHGGGDADVELNADVDVELDQKNNSRDREADVTEESDTSDSEEEEGEEKEEEEYPEGVDREEDEWDRESKEEPTGTGHAAEDVKGDALTPLPLFSSEDDTNPACVIQASNSVLQDLNISASVERSGEGVWVSTASHLSHLTVGRNEELISDVIRLEPFGKELPSSVHVAVPYTGSPLPRNDYREIAFKVSTDGDTWRLVHAQSSDVQFEDYKGFFSQLKLRRLCLLAVVLRLKREHIILESTGGSVKSSVDHRVSLEWSSHPKRTKKGKLTLEVRPTTAFVHGLKERDPLGYEWLLTMGPVVYLPVHNFRRAVTVTLPCPHHETANLNALPQWRDPAIPAPLRRISQAPYGQMLLEKVRKPEDRKDALHVMMYDRKTERWSLQFNNLAREEAETEVMFKPTKLADGYMVMRTVLDVPQPLEDLAQQVDRMLRETYVCWILHRHGKEPDRMVVRCVTPGALEQAEDELRNAGFSDISPVSEEVGLLEGQSVIISLGGNLVIDDEDGGVEVAMRFHANQQVVCEFWIKARDRFADRGYPTYRGTLMVHAEEEGGERRLLCDMAVTLPKTEKRFERATRAKRVDVANDPLNNHMLDWLSFELGKHWEDLGKALKQTNATLQRVKRNFPYDSKTQAFNMLYQWRQAQSKATDKVRALTLALKKSNNHVLAENLMKRCASSHVSEGP